MEIFKLADPAVKKAAPQEKDYRLSDGAGLYLGWNRNQDVNMIGKKMPSSM